jgi:hypothetical protein
MNKLQLFTRYYITKVERGMDQSRSRGTELPCKLREGLSLLMRRLSRMRSSKTQFKIEFLGAFYGPKTLWYDGLWSFPI